MVESMEQRLDRAAALKPIGFRPFQRLNRPEYARSVKDLLGIEVDVNAFLPPDTMSHGFDNVADAQMFSPTLMEGYLRAASKVSSLAIGDRNASPSETTYKTDRTAAQLDHVEGAPFGTRGGISVIRNFPRGRRLQLPDDAALRALLASSTAARSRASRSRSRSTASASRFSPSTPA